MTHNFVCMFMWYYVKLINCTFSNQKFKKYIKIKITQSKSYEFRLQISQVFNLESINFKN